jgi:hypothetical protein
MKSNEATGGWRKPHNEELHNLYPLPSIIRMTKSRRMRLAGHVAQMEANRNAYRISVCRPERPRRRGWTILKWISDRMGWINLPQVRDQ